MLPIIAVLAAAVAAATVSAPAAHATSPHHVEVVGQHSVLWNDTLEAPVATALEALEAAAAGRFQVVVQGDPGLGCSQLYVFAVGGEVAHGGAGWQYWVGAPGGWELPDVGAGCYALHPGQAVAWRWTPG